MLNSVITATGSYIPERIISNDSFLNAKFYNANGDLNSKSNQEITAKFEEITGIQKRRYVDDSLVTSDIAYFSALDALNSSGIDKETIDYIIVAHNFGDVKANNRKSDMVPSLAARVKHKLGIHNPSTVSFDLIFGCPGWLQGLINADALIKSGQARKVMVIGAETLSRISDPSDIDSMIYSDGAGCVIAEAIESDGQIGILGHSSRSDALEFSNLLWMDKSFDPGFEGNDLFLKMLGHKLYKYALQTVPGLVKECIDKVKVSIDQIKKVFIHQANNKMDEEIMLRILSSFNIKDGLQEIMNRIMPMTISWLGNSSVATLPTLFDLFLKEKLEGHNYNRGDYYVFASVGAGMNVNCMLYRLP